MEQLVLDVGSISGRFGEKFPSTKCRNSDTATNNETGNIIDHAKTMSNRQMKKLRKQQLSLHGIEGLVPVPFSSESEMTQSSLFVIDGTIAYLKCRTYAVLGSPPSSTDASTENESKYYGTGKQKAEEKAADKEVECGDAQPPIVIDDNHLLVMAKIANADVHPSYWDRNKLLFRLLSNYVPPCLTFFGSQTYGCVTSGENEKAMTNNN